MCQGHDQIDHMTMCSQVKDANAAKCELCGSRAFLYCLSDDAFLCDKCDKWVHGANFLAQRHPRCFLCDTCQNLTQRFRVGAAKQVVLPEANVGNMRQCDSESSKLPFLFL